MRGSVVKCSVGRGESGVKFGGNIWVLNWWKSKDWGKTVYAIWWEKILETIYSTFFVFLMRIFVNCICLACIVVILCVFVVPYVYLFYYVCIAVLTLDAGLLAKVRIRNVLRPTTSTQVFLGFPVSTSECSDGSPVSKLLLHASHVALPT